ncbi:MAG: NAD(P)/FAD-dependent oxidoreductase [Clostridia bacterium]
MRGVQMQYDVIVVGAGISGLTAAALLSKRGLRVVVIDKAYNPGGSCGTFKRNGQIFDQGSAMLYGFGETGFNPHRFVFNLLEEPIDMIKHDLLYCVNYMGRRIMFWPDTEKFAQELGEVFPSEKENIIRFYKDLLRMYNHVMVENPAFSTPDEIDGRNSLKGLLRHPASYARFLGYLNKSTEWLLGKYFKDPEIFRFFNKLTSTYCYTTVRETPAILSAIMFVDNHVGGSFYPAGSTVFLPGKLEKVIEENGGDMLMEQEVVKILFRLGKPAGVALQGGRELFAKDIIYSGTVWNIYGKLLKEPDVSKARIRWNQEMVPTYPSVMLYAQVDSKAIPGDTLPIEMLVGNPDIIDENEVTVYIPSIDDRTLCDEDSHVMMVIGPTVEKWDRGNKHAYEQCKEKEMARLMSVLGKRFPGINDAVRHAELSTPCTIEKYTMKNGGSVAGPKQMLGQHMLKRLRTRSEWDSLYFCGESTVMGTGTPAVTVSGLSAANAVLKKNGLEAYVCRKNMKNHVRTVGIPFRKEAMYPDYPEETRRVMHMAAKCQYCENQSCMDQGTLDVRGIMRRVTVGNFAGARKLAEKAVFQGDWSEVLWNAQNCCVQKEKAGEPVEIRKVLEFLWGQGGS